jgi:phosphoribosylamine-glycine ligase
MVIGPDKAGARLEGSKDFAKHFMRKYKNSNGGIQNIPLRKNTKPEFSFSGA